MRAEPTPGRDISAFALDLAPWMDDLYDPEVGLLWNPPGSFDGDGLRAGSVHLVPQSGWYAVSLAARGDGDRLATVVDALLARQHHAPGEAWDGTFARFGEWPEPTVGAVEWEDYDPNWRQFLGTTLTLLLRRHRDLLDPGRAARIEDAVRRAVAGEPEGRLAWHYTNIALQHAWLLVEWGDADAGHALAETIVGRWREHRTFPEFNSPTYDGIDLWGLALWRGHSSSDRLRAWGAELEAGLWQTIASRYHAGLRNLAGPYTRAYGLDLGRHVGLLGVWIGAAAGMDAAALPPLGAERVVAHSHDLLATPAVARAGTKAPAVVVGALQRFGGTERLVHDVITARPTHREATAWLAPHVMVGAEGGESDWQGWYQFVAGTVHWRRPDGSIGVLRYVPDGPPRGRAEPGLLRVGGPGRIEVHEPSPD
nr:hypothetical protein [Acidimicrobiia bacterium]